MPSEGHRRIERGTDRVAAFVEHHDRPRTEVLLHGLEQVPRRRLEYRGVDPGPLERAMADLVENAVEYSPSDRGPGVPDEAQERIFEPLQRYGDAPRPEGDDAAEHQAEPERQASS